MIEKRTGWEMVIDPDMSGKLFYCSVKKALIIIEFYV